MIRFNTFMLGTPITSETGEDFMQAANADICRWMTWGTQK